MPTTGTHHLKQASPLFLCLLQAALCNDLLVYATMYVQDCSTHALHRPPPPPGLLPPIRAGSAWKVPIDAHTHIHTQKDMHAISHASTHVHTRTHTYTSQAPTPGLLSPSTAGAAWKVPTVTLLDSSMDAEATAVALERRRNALMVCAR
jgi:hypothetical protein